MVRSGKLALVLPVALTLCLVQSACAPAESEANAPEVMVYKSPYCGCCSKWVAHMEDEGFVVKTVEVSDVTPIKKKYGLPPGMASCHTALVDGYVVEGHVPADVVRRMLAEKPDILGIAVPGMPIGSPGMEQGNRVDSYKIVTFDAEGSTSVYETR